VSTIAQAEPVWVTVGVDTHRDLHVAGARDQLGRRIGTTLIPTTPTGYQQLLDWARHLGEITAFGIEGTGCYGAGLARYLRGKGYRVIEVNRPDRATRRRKGKSDPVDADAAARTVQAGDQTGTPKAGTGTVEMLRVLRVARQTALKARTQATNALRALLVTAPAELREQLRGLSKTTLPERPPPSTQAQAGWEAPAQPRCWRCGRLGSATPRSPPRSARWRPRSTGCSPSTPPHC
jgi:transposase